MNSGHCGDKVGMEWRVRNQEQECSAAQVQESQKDSQAEQVKMEVHRAGGWPGYGGLLSDWVLEPFKGLAAAGSWSCQPQNDS